MNAKAITTAAGVVGILALTTLVGCGGGSDASPSAGDSSTGSGNAAAGAPIFRKVCAACHGPAGKGMPNLGKDMTASAFIKDSTDEDLLKFVKVGRLPGDPLSDGKSAMPPKGGDPTLTDKQIMDVIAFMRTIQQ